MKMEEIEIGKIYECLYRGRKAPVHVSHTSRIYVLGQNLDTGRPVTLSASQVKCRIESMSEWRLHNGEARI